MFKVDVNGQIYIDFDYFEKVLALDLDEVRLVVDSMCEAGVSVDRVFFDPAGIFVIAHRLGDVSYVTAFLGRRRITAPADSDWRDRLLSGVSL